MVNHNQNYRNSEERSKHPKVEFSSQKIRHIRSSNDNLNKANGSTMLHESVPEIQDESLDLSSNNSFLAEDSDDSYQPAQGIAKQESATTSYGPKTEDKNERSQLMSINQDGEQKLNFIHMVKLATTDPKALIREVLRLPLKSLFWKGIRYRNL